MSSAEPDPHPLRVFERMGAVAEYQPHVGCLVCEALRPGGDLLRTLGRDDDAVAAYLRAIEVDAALGNEGFVARSQIGIASALFARGDKAQAARIASTALATAERLGFPAVARAARDLI